MSNPKQAYKQLIQLRKEVSLLGSCESLLGWDQEVYMPPKGTPHRAAQTTLLSGMIHERFTSPAMGEWLSECEASDLTGDLVGDSLSDEAVNIREIRRAYDRKVKLPKSLVEELAHTTTLAHSAWIEAREKSHFATFRPWLEKIVELKRQEADCYGFEKVRYDALLDEYEPGETTENLTRLFGGLQEELSPLVRQIKDSPKQPD
ncbi:MAG: carboxypeptidase M32, partial [Planctomycetota bacterium]|nr:carboxypeptidase M32 [Planctomycetota bacterium]